MNKFSILDTLNNKAKLSEEEKYNSEVLKILQKEAKEADKLQKELDKVNFRIQFLIGKYAYVTSLSKAVKLTHLTQSTVYKYKKLYIKVIKDSGQELPPIKEKIKNYSLLKYLIENNRVSEEVKEKYYRDNNI